MLRDLDLTIHQLLLQYANIPSGVIISSDIPTANTIANSLSDQIISVYLYKITENTGLRSNAWKRHNNPNGTVTPVQPIPRINCSYIITSWVPNAFKEYNSDAVQDEHYILGSIMSALLTFPNLPRSVLQGDINQFALAHSDFEFPTAVMLGDDIKSPGEFWSAMGYKIKPFINYVVTIGVDPNSITNVSPLVTEINMKTGNFKEQFNNGYYLIGGKVLFNNNPVPYATVTVTGNASDGTLVNRSVNCNSDGYFYFNRIPPSAPAHEYTFQASSIIEGTLYSNTINTAVPKPESETDRFYTVNLQ